MRLSTSEFRTVAARISALSTGHVGFDFETTGLSAYSRAKAFVMGFTDEKGGKFHIDLSPDLAMDLTSFFSNPKLKYCAHNIKFELSFLREQFQVEVQGILWDTEVMARIEYNEHMRYDLQSCAVRINETKYPPMLEWLKKRGHKDKYHEAPRDILDPYVEQDAWLSWELCRRQVALFKHWDIATKPPIKPIVQLEIEVLPHLFQMETYGLLVDVQYCREALTYEQARITEAKQAFEHETQVRFVDSRKVLAPVFDARAVRYGRTDLGNPSFTESSLAGQESDRAVRLLLQYRTAKKRASSYWENFLELECNGIIHPRIRQNQAATGRMSIRDPSCQNWPTDDDDPRYPIRRAFVARPSSHIFSLDYSQMELRLMVDEAGDRGMVEAFLSGKDFHQETADMAEVPRSLAKNGRFAKLYGAGIPRVAETLGISLELSERICHAIDKSSPGVTEYIRKLIRMAERSAYGTNFLGRRYYFDRKFAYKYPNYKIQGGCGEILRIAIRDVARYITQARAHSDTQILIPIHDELVINVHASDMKLIPEIKRLMIAAHQSKKHLDMDVGIHYGPNFHDLEPYAI